MGKHKQATCKFCFRVMRSDHLKQHIKVHLKYQPKSNEELCRELVLEIADKVVDSQPTKDVNLVRTGTKRKFKEEVNQQVVAQFLNRDLSINPYFDPETLEKAALEMHEEYQQKIALGAALYKILGKGVVTEESFPNDWKEALDLYMKQGHEIDCENVVLKAWQTELLKWINNPTDRHVLWVVGKACGEGKTFFQKYVRSLFGRRRVVAGGINIKCNSASICHALTKRPLSTTDIFLFNIGKSKKKFEDVNYELLEDLKDGDAFASKYNSQELKIKVPNVVVVFSNEYPNTRELARDRWKVFSIVSDELVEKQVKENGQSDAFLTKKKRVLKTSDCDSDSDVY